MKKDDWRALGISMLFPLLVISACIYSCVRKNRAETKRNEIVLDSIAKREKYVKDSIDSVENSPEYKARMDSLDRARKLRIENEEKETIVMVSAGDTEYHFMTQCFDLSDLGKIRFMSEYNAKKSGLKKCGLCVKDFSHDKYIHVDNVSQYILDNYDVSDIIDLFDISMDDFVEEPDFERDPGYDQRDY
jgi:hypothetical protein